MKGFIYRLGTDLKELGEQLNIVLLITLGLKIRESV